MSKKHQKQVKLVRSLLSKPIWYNQTITHRNWPLIKRAIKNYQPISVTTMPPELQYNYEDLEQLRYWRQSYEAFVLKPPMSLVGVTA